MTDNKSNAAGASGLGTTLFLIFLVLKLANVVQWSWWWVTSPIWLPMALLIVMIVLYLIWKGIENILN